MTKWPDIRSSAALQTVCRLLVNQPLDRFHLHGKPQRIVLKTCETKVLVPLSKLFALGVNDDEPPTAHTCKITHDSQCFNQQPRAKTITLKNRPYTQPSDQIRRDGQSPNSPAHAARYVNGTHGRRRQCEESGDRAVRGNTNMAAAQPAKTILHSLRANPSVKMDIATRKVVKPLGRHMPIITEHAPRRHWQLLFLGWASHHPVQANRNHRQRHRCLPGRKRLARYGTAYPQVWQPADESSSSSWHQLI